MAQSLSYMIQDRHNTQHENKHDSYPIKEERKESNPPDEKVYNQKYNKQKTNIPYLRLDA